MQLLCRCKRPHKSNVALTDVSFYLSKLSLVKFKTMIKHLFCTFYCYLALNQNMVGQFLKSQKYFILNIIQLPRGLKITDKFGTTTLPL